MGSEPKMPELPESLCEHLDAYFAAWGKTACDKLHNEIQAYAAGIRAEVLGEVRAVVQEIDTGNLHPEDLEFAKGYNNCAKFVRAALTTLENPNE